MQLAKAEGLIKGSRFTLLQQKATRVFYSGRELAVAYSQATSL